MPNKVAYGLPLDDKRKKRLPSIRFGAAFDCPSTGTGRIPRDSFHDIQNWPACTLLWADSCIVRKIPVPELNGNATNRDFSEMGHAGILRYLAHRDNNSHNRRTEFMAVRTDSLVAAFPFTMPVESLRVLLTRSGGEFADYPGD